jgi:hypothetical protein
MSTHEDVQKSPLENPAVRYGIGLFLAATTVVVAFLFVEGILRTALLVTAIFQAAFVPKLFKIAVEQDDPPESLAEMLR